MQLAGHCRRAEKSGIFVSFKGGDLFGNVSERLGLFYGKGRRF